MRTRHAASIALAGCATLWLGAAQVAPTQQQSGANPAAHADAMAWLRYVADETRKLRIEVSELRLAVEDARIPELERSLVAAQSERQCLEQEISDYSQQVLSLDSQLAQPGIAAEEQQQLFARKAELSAEMSGRLRQRQDLLAAQETAARDRLDNQRRTIRAALAHKSELTATEPELIRTADVGRINGRSRSGRENCALPPVTPAGRRPRPFRGREPKEETVMKTYTDRALLIAGIVGVTALFAPTARAAEPNSTHVAGACVIDKTSVAWASVSDAELRFDAGQSGDIVARCNVINPKDDGLVNPIWKKMEVVYRDPDGGGIAYQVLVTLKSVSNGGVVPAVPVAQFNSNIFGVALAPVMNSAPIVMPFNFAANAYWIEIRIKRPPPR